MLLCKVDGRSLSSIILNTKKPSLRLLFTRYWWLLMSKAFMVAYYWLVIDSNLDVWLIFLRFQLFLVLACFFWPQQLAIEVTLELCTLQIPLGVKSGCNFFFNSVILMQLATQIVDVLRRFPIGRHPSIARVVVFILFWNAIRFPRVLFGSDAQFHGIFFLLLCTIYLWGFLGRTPVSP